MATGGMIWHTESKKAIDIALAEVGYREKSSNSGLEVDGIVGNDTWQKLLGG